MVGALEARAKGATCDAIIKNRAETLRAQMLLVNRFCWRQIRLDQPLAGMTLCLTNVLDVANDSIINSVPDLVELAVVVPVHIAIGVKVLANDCAHEIRATVDGKDG